MEEERQFTITLSYKFHILVARAAKVTGKTPEEVIELIVKVGIGDMAKFVMEESLKESGKVPSPFDKTISNHQECNHEWIEDRSPGGNPFCFKCGYKGRS